MLSKFKSCLVPFAGKALFLFLIFLMIPHYTLGQSAYDITPGTKGNEITLSLANISETLNAENLSVNLNNDNQYLEFKNNSANVNLINPNSSKEAVFTFDVKREIPVNQKDTVYFTVQNNKGLLATKEE